MRNHYKPWFARTLDSRAKEQTPWRRNAVVEITKQEIEFEAAFRSRKERVEISRRLLGEIGVETRPPSPSKASSMRALVENWCESLKGKTP